MKRRDLPFLLRNGTLSLKSESEYNLFVSQETLCLSFGPSRTAGVRQTGTTFHSLCLSAKTQVIGVAGDLWLLPEAEISAQTVRIGGVGEKTAQAVQSGVEVNLAPGDYTLTLYDGWPACDILGNRLSLHFEGGDVLENTYARFYWDTLLPSVIEQTDALDYPLPDGYVVSTLQPGEYAGTYPDVDHEFQTKGRLAMRGDCEISVVERMMNLQFRLMREDPVGLWRNPCAIQPGGQREYHVRRDSLDRTANAEMFLVTGNVEILETAWRYFATTKDEAWLRTHVEELEGAASLLAHLTDRNGKLWSDVYYEDQVIKDGMECMSAALAARGLELLAELEHHLSRFAQEETYRNLSARLAETLVKPVPEGFWDEKGGHFVDWIDRSGQVHDHLHLLANCLPVLFGYASEEQVLAVNHLIRSQFDEYQRFPTFLSPCIADYTPDEIGSGGPYDLCAAGRYWCWDAAYWAFLGRGDVIGQQLRRVAEQAKLDGYRMGERYDMNHVYYQDDKNWHGAPYYYEYPCVFIRVLMHEYLGIRAGFDVDVELCPTLDHPGKVCADAYGVEYEYGSDMFTIRNTASHGRTVRLRLEHLYRGAKLVVGDMPLTPGQVFELQAGENLTVCIG